jgi:hypothetical protein
VQTLEVVISVAEKRTVDVRYGFVEGTLSKLEGDHSRRKANLLGL